MEPAGYEEAKDLAESVMDGGFVWTIDGPKITQAAALIYQHYSETLPPFIWNRLSLDALQGIVRDQIISWSAIYFWDAPYMDEAGEDFIWGWMVDGVVRKEHTGSYR